MVGTLFVVAILILSQAGTLIRFAAASSLAICFWRLLIASLFLLPLLIHRRRFAIYSKLTRHDWLKLILSGIFLFTHFYFFFRSAQETTVADCTILFSLNPVTTAIGAWFLFHERMTLHLSAACLLGLAGVVVTTLGSLKSHAAAHASLQGDLFGVIAGICFSGYILTGKKIRLKMSNIPYTFAIYAQTAIYAAFAMGLCGTPFTGYTDQTWIAFAALAIFTTLLGHALFTYCLNYLNVNFMSCMTLTEPLLAAIAGWFLFKEPLSAASLFGFALTCLSVVTLYAPSMRELLRGN